MKIAGQNLENKLEKIKNKHSLRTFFHTLNSGGPQGLSLLEVLVALSLAAILFLSVNVIVESEREQLESSLDALERAIRFSGNEAVLRGSMVRIHILMDKVPQEFAVEAGPVGEFVLPSMEPFLDERKLSLRDLERRDKLLQSINKQFHKIKEFQEENYQLPSSIKILGAATTSRESMVQDGEANLYFFPNGEKEAALLAVGSSKEMVALEISPYIDQIDRVYKKLESRDNDALLDEMDSLLKSFFENWKKD